MGGPASLLKEGAKLTEKDEVGWGGDLKRRERGEKETRRSLLFFFFFFFSHESIFF